MNPRTPPTRRPAAFTLVELLVTTVVASVVMLGVYHTFWAGLLSWRRTNGDLGAMQEARNVLDNLRGELASTALPPSADQPVFQAVPGRLTFFTDWALSDRAIVPARGTSYVTYEVLTPDGHSRGPLSLVRRRRFYSGSLPISEESSAVVLTGIRSVAFRYLSTASLAGQPQWQDTWPTPGPPPKAVRIDLVMEASGGAGTRPTRLTATVAIPARPEATPETPPAKG